jgi:hypothetical protein
MNLCNPGSPRSRFARRRLIAPVAAFCLLAGIARALAQDVMVPLPTIPYPSLQPAPETTSAAPAPTGSTAPAASGATALRQPFQWGSLIFRPRLSYQALYGNGFQSAPGQPQTTAIRQLSPGLGIDIGSRWRLDYTPTFMFYSDPSFRNNVNQFINLAGDTDYYDWKFSLSQNCLLTSNPQVETAQQTDQQTYSTSFRASYPLNSEMSLDLGANQNLVFLQEFTNSVGSSLDWSTVDWLNFHWGPNLSAAGGVGFGYVDVGAGSDTTYEQLQGRIAWQVANKVNLSVNGGVELRQFLDSSAPQLLNPLFGLVLNYQPAEVTSISLNGSRTVSPSYFENIATESITINASVNQRFFEILHLVVSGGYTRTIYQTAGATDPTDPSFGRQDDYSYVGASLYTSFLKRGTASVYYSVSKNVSNRSGYGYSSDQIGFQLAYRY